MGQQEYSPVVPYLTRDKSNVMLLSILSNYEEKAISCKLDTSDTLCLGTFKVVSSLFPFSRYVKVRI